MAYNFCVMPVRAAMRQETEWAGRLERSSGAACEIVNAERGGVAGGVSSSEVLTLQVLVVQKGCLEAASRSSRTNCGGAVLGEGSGTVLPFSTIATEKGCDIQRETLGM